MAHDLEEFDIAITVSTVSPDDDFYKYAPYAECFFEGRSGTAYLTREQLEGRQISFDNLRAVVALGIIKGGMDSGYPHVEKEGFHCLTIEDGVKTVAFEVLGFRLDRDERGVVPLPPATPVSEEVREDGRILAHVKQVVIATSRVAQMGSAMRGLGFSPLTYGGATWSPYSGFTPYATTGVGMNTGPFYGNVTTGNILQGDFVPNANVGTHMGPLYVNAGNLLGPGGPNINTGAGMNLGPLNVGGNWGAGGPNINTGCGCTIM